MWICWFGALKFNQNWIKHKKRRKNMLVFAVFEHFWRFFNFGRILAHQTTKFTFLEVYCFFWHPTHLWMWLSSARKKIGPNLAECRCKGPELDYQDLLIRGEKSLTCSKNRTEHSHLNIGYDNLGYYGSLWLSTQN